MVTVYHVQRDVLNVTPLILVIVLVASQDISSTEPHKAAVLVTYLTVTLVTLLDVLNVLQTIF